MRAYIGLGSNMGEREKYLARAVDALGATPGVEVVKVSSFYETEPVGYTDQPMFVNAAVAVDTTLSPVELLRETQRIENALGRVRSIRWGPRTIDIDILLYGDEVVNTKELTVPHPLMHERGFVLAPLAEVAPDAVHPVLRLTVRELLEELEKAGG